MNEYKVNQWIDISDYRISRHLRKRWKKRRLDYTPKGKREVNDVDDSITGLKKIIRIYPERGSLRVTDKKYEFVIDPGNKTIITMNAFKRKTTRKEYLNKKERYT